MEEKNKRKSIVYLTIGVLTLIALVVGATYAFFQAQNKNGTSFNANVTAGTTDNLTFSINDLDVGYDNITDEDGNNGMVINATQQNFGEKDNSIGDGVTGKAILIANDSSKEAKFNYYVYVNIINNDLEYTSYKNGAGAVKLVPLDDNDKTTYINPVPELIMTIRKNGTQYTNDIGGLTKTTITTKDGEVTGYDITEVRRNILIKEETIEVTTKTPNSRTEDTWEISIILKNLETNQQLNTEKEVKGEVLIQSEKIEPIQDKLLADANKEGKETLLYHNGMIKIDDQVMDAEDYSYRYSGASDDVNNYICFGGPCSNNPEEEENYSNLYRIIGIFPTDASHTTYQMKIIKADAITETELGGEGVGAYHGKYNGGSSTYKGNKSTYYPKIESYYWNNEANNNDWSKSNLNTKNLNDVYLKYIQGKEEGKWEKMLEKHIWITEGNTWYTIGTQNAKTAYTNEITSPAAGSALVDAATTYKAKIGLMYVSDYMYGASKEYWTKVGYDSSTTDDYRSATDSNWLYMGLFEWTISRRSDSSGNAFSVASPGYVNTYYFSHNFAVRPCLYLNSNIKIIDGDGTSTNPYKLGV